MNQPLLFPLGLSTYTKRVTSVGSSRNAYGKLIEEIVGESLGASVCSDYQQELCPDLDFKGVPVEVKGSIRGMFTLYPWRMKRELIYANKHTSPYLYALLDYKASTEKISTLKFSNILSAKLYLLCISEVLQLCEGLKLRKIKKVGGCGYHREGYREGYVSLPRPTACDYHTNLMAGGMGVPTYISPRIASLLENDEIKI